MVRAVVATLPAAALSLLLSACGGHEELSGRAGDVAFAQSMIPHHEQALEMAEIALVKDPTGTVADLAREITREQEPEVVLLRSWLDEWGAEELAHGGGPGSETDAAHDHGMSGMATGDELAALAEARGAEFERMWLDLMIAHHEGAIEMAEQVAGTTDDPEVAALADAVVESQRDEIDRMERVRER